MQLDWDNYSKMEGKPYMRLTIIINKIGHVTHSVHVETYSLRMPGENSMYEHEAAQGFRAVAEVMHQMADKKEIDGASLNWQLRVAIANEDFEEAARLQRMIKEAGAFGKESAGSV